MGAEDRWHVASSGAFVRQSLLDATPIVLSGLRLPGGEIEQRAWSAVDGATGLPVLVVDYTNATKVPVALAIAVSSTPSAPTTATIDVADGVVTANGEAVAKFSRQPSRYGYATNGRSAQEITVAGDADPTFPESGVSSESGAANVGFVFPLPHTATVRAVFPLRAGVQASELARIDLPSLPPSDRVIAGWKAQTARGPRFDLPERQIEEAVDAARSHLLVHVAGDDPLRWPGVAVDGCERSELTMALDEQGLAAEAERLLLAATDLQNSDGSFDHARLDATASWIVAVERHIVLTGNIDIADALVERVASGVHWLAKQQRGSRLRPSRRFFGVGDAPEWVSAEERQSYNARWTARAYRSAISILELADQPDAALAVRLHLDALTDEMSHRSIASDGPGDGALSADPIDQLRRDLLEGEPLWTWPTADDPHDPARTAAFLRLVRSIVVNDSGSSVDLVPGFGEAWLGQPVALLRLPTRGGSLSFAVRWHGARPAVLWEMEGDRPFTLTCSEIDPNWSTTERRGEALLDAPVLDHVHVHEHGHSHDHGHDHDHDHRESVAEPPQDGGGSFS